MLEIHVPFALLFSHLQEFNLEDFRMPVERNLKQLLWGALMEFS